MELALIKYLTFLLWFAIVLWLLKLWLQSNKTKRNQEEEKNEALEVQKELHKQALKEKEMKNNN